MRIIEYFVGERSRIVSLTLKAVFLSIDVVGTVNGSYYALII